MGRKMKRPWLRAMALTVLLGGGPSGPSIQAQSPDAPSSSGRALASGPEAPRGAAAGTNPETITPRSERPPESLDGLGLDEALRLMETFHPSLHATRERAGAARGAVGQADRWPNPELELRAESLSLKHGGASRGEYLVGVEQPIVVSGRLRAAKERAQAEHLSAVQSIELRRRELRARVKAAFNAILYFQEALRSQREMETIAQRIVAIAAARVAAGDAAEGDKTRAEIENSRVSLRRATLEADLATAKLDLVKAIGLPELRLGTCDGSLQNALALPNLDDLLISLVKHPQMAAAEASLAAAHASLKQARSERLADPTLGLSYRRREEDDDNMIEFGVKIPLPLFDRKQGAIESAGHTIRAAHAELEATRRALYAQVAAAHAAVAREAINVKTLRDDIVPKAQRSLQLAQAAYEHGDSGLLELLDARRTMTESQFNYLTALRDLSQ
ncbi:MAG: TolC family protein, partial [Planctomycetes bacterium]|nr:TolC family protein [Planctomycetota bacterium]